MTLYCVETENGKGGKRQSYFDDDDIKLRGTGIDRARRFAAHLERQGFSTEIFRVVGGVRTGSRVRIAA